MYRLSESGYFLAKVVKLDSGPSEILVPHGDYYAQIKLG